MIFSIEGGMLKTLVILPSYNERKNIREISLDILDLGLDYSICIVDDNSPDQTARFVKDFRSTLPSDMQSRIHLIIREKKDGRGGAVKTGIQWGLENVQDTQAFVEMDCDFSHSPTDIPTGVRLLENADMAMGSRYPDGRVIGWPLSRRVFSFLANFLTRFLINWHIHDYTNGFRFYSKKAAELMCQLPQRHKGYIFLSETTANFLKMGLRIKSFPIVFVNRERGKSNTTIKEIFAALTGILDVAWRYRGGSDDK